MYDREPERGGKRYMLCNASRALSLGQQYRTLLKVTEIHVTAERCLILPMAAAHPTVCSHRGSLAIFYLMMERLYARWTCEIRI